ncbi:MAG: hypothetical protein A2Z31_05595 [candidate division NC10 bacterium RBG_16_65_8]|nr:MAG: hypothetical protein A2Z31_05595 [candidate division NC10 bacterium RBG_16_65_8]
MAGIVAAVDDLFFGAKLRETARGLGVPLVLVSSSQEVAAAVRERRPALLIVDLQSDAGRPLETIRAIKADPDLRGTPVLGYFSHVRDDLKAAAAEAGCDELLPRSAFSARLPEILRRGAPATDTGCAAGAPPGA